MGASARSKRGARALLVLLTAGLLCLAPLTLVVPYGGMQAAAAALQSWPGRSLAHSLTAAANRGVVVLRYDVQLGLCNQLNSHVNALMLGHALGVDAVLVPQAWSRHPGDFNRSKEEQRWVMDNPITTLLDLRSMAASWAHRGVRLVEADAAGLQQTKQHNCIRTRSVEEQLRAVLVDPPKYLRLPLLRLVAQARNEIDAVRMQHGPSACVLLDAGNMFWAAEFTSSANLAALAAATLRFPPHIEALADRIVKQIGPTFNGVHLRVEPDMGLNPEAIIPKYIALMRELGFNSTTPLYMASGLLSYSDATGFDRIAARLQKERLCSQVVAKERILPAATFEGLHSEQLALVDLLVLARTARFVGHSVSTFSFVAHDLRLMRLGTVHSVSARLIDFPKGGRQPANYMLPVDLSLVENS